MANRSRNAKIPYIISPHGMLEPWALSQGRLKKRIAMKLYQRLDLEKADCLHATSEMEAISMRQLGLKNPIAVILISRRSEHIGKRTPCCHLNR
jgi:hypothetical protein